MTVISIRAAALAAAATCALTAAPALAQQASATRATDPTATSGVSADAIPEVVVTTERRSEYLRNVPVSVGVISGAGRHDFQAGGDDTLLSQSGRVPSLYLESTTGRIFPRFYIRGLGSTDFYLGAHRSPTGVGRQAAVPLFDGAHLDDLGVGADRLGFDVDRFGVALRLGDACIGVGVGDIGLCRERGLFVGDLGVDLVEYLLRNRDIACPGKLVDLQADPPEKFWNFPERRVDQIGLVAVVNPLHAQLRGTLDDRAAYRIAQGTGDDLVHVGAVTLKQDHGLGRIDMVAYRDVGAERQAVLSLKPELSSTWFCSVFERVQV